MRSMRRDAILDIYQLLLAVFLFVSPWLFAFVSRTLRADDWLSAALVAVISFTALVAFREFYPWYVDCRLPLDFGFPNSSPDAH
jgi:hypothetical protein